MAGERKDAGSKSAVRRTQILRLSKTEQFCLVKWGTNDQGAGSANLFQDYQELREQPKGDQEEAIVEWECLKKT